MVEASENEDDDVEAEDEGGQEDEAEEKDDLVVDVMLGEPGGSTFNTLVLGGTDVVVPLERDLDEDPFQDDEVWLCASDGTVIQRRYFSDDEVEEDEDKRILFYRFTGVRYGVYSVWTKIGGQAAELFRGLLVNRTGVFLGDEALGETREGPAMAAGPAEDESAGIEAVVSIGADEDSDDGSDEDDLDVDQSDDEDET